MSVLEPKDVCEVIPVEDEAPFREFVESGARGILMVPESYGGQERLSLKSEAGDFAKWLGANHAEVAIEMPSADRLVLRSNDVWLPLVFLASDVALPIYLGLVTNYLYDRMKGALRDDRPRAHLSAEYIDGETGSVKRFNFEGDADALKDAVRALDLNEFYDD